jgi:hypothetical protein
LGSPERTLLKTLEREHVEAVETIYVHREPDKGGEIFVAGIRERLAAVEFKGKLFELRMPDGIKDPADLHAADLNQSKARLTEAIRLSMALEFPRRTERNGRNAGDGAQPRKTLRSIAPPPLEALSGRSAARSGPRICGRRESRDRLRFFLCRLAVARGPGSRYWQ